MSLGNIPAMTGYDFYPPGNFIFIPSTIFAIALFKNNILELIRLLGIFLYYGFMSAALFTVVYILTVKHTDNLFPMYTFISILSILLLDRFLRRLRDAVTGRHGNKLKIAFENLSDKLSRARSFKEIAGCISYSCFTDLFCGQCAVLIYNEDNSQYRGKNLWNINRGLIQGMPVTQDSSSVIIDSSHILLEYINKKHSLIKIEEIEYWILNNGISVAIDDPLRQTELILPVFFENRLSAIIILGVKTDGSVYSKNEMDFLYQLGINLSPHIENARILHRLEETLEERTQKLRNSEEKYRTLLQTNNVGFFEIDINGNITSCNDVVLSFTGYAKDEFIGINVKKLLPQESSRKIFEVYIQVFKKELVLGSIEHEVIRKDGSIGFVETTISSITDPEGKVTGTRTIAIDVANRKSN